MTHGRDFDGELTGSRGAEYAYRFDTDVMHPLMIRSFSPFFRKGSLLELGSGRGDLTVRLVEHFEQVTCVEASGIAIDDARARLGERVTFVNATLESASLDQRYQNVVFTHVLEHVDDPVVVLRRVNEEWLADGGGSSSSALTPTRPPGRSPSRWA